MRFTALAMSAGSQGFCRNRLPDTGGAATSEADRVNLIRALLAPWFGSAKRAGPERFPSALQQGIDQLQQLLVLRAAGAATQALADPHTRHAPWADVGLVLHDGRIRQRASRQRPNVTNAAFVENSFAIPTSRTG